MSIHKKIVYLTAVQGQGHIIRIGPTSLNPNAQRNPSIKIDSHKGIKLVNLCVTRCVYSFGLYQLRLTLAYIVEQGCAYGH